MSVFTIYVCPACDAIATDLHAAQHGCRPGCGMWVKTRVIAFSEWERLDRENYRQRFVLDAVLDRALQRGGEA